MARVFRVQFHFKSITRQSALFHIYMHDHLTIIYNYYYYYYYSNI